MSYVFTVGRVSARWEKPCEEARDETERWPYPNPEVRRWVVEFADLDALLAFAKKYGDVIISADPHIDGPPEITIYDGYIE